MTKEYEDGAVVRDIVSGHYVPTINAPMFCVSELLGHLAEGYPFAMSWIVRGKEVTCSLRSRGDGGVDVSEVARQFGGGGHAGAAGFRVPFDEFAAAVSAGGVLGRGNVPE